ncbi:aldose 1-epimerase family protein, partial [Escherichia coli]
MKNEIWSWIGDLSQVAGIKHYELRSGRAKGTEAFDVRTGAGLAFTVVKDRALDIAWASYKDTALSFITPNGIVAPAFFESQGNGFLRSFYAGLLTTCGLSYIGTPCEDNGETLGLHGRLAATPAEEVGYRTERTDDGIEFVINGKVRETRLFGENLTLERTIRCRYGENVLRIEDKVTNHGFTRQPLQILYHFNYGWPLLSPQAEILLSAKSVTPRTPHAAE